MTTKDRILYTIHTNIHSLTNPTLSVAEFQQRLQTITRLVLEL